jgi:CheY-like chemotaxis protein
MHPQERAGYTRRSMGTVVVVAEEILFLSRIQEAARDAGVTLHVVRAGEDLLTAARSGARLVLVDADSERLPWQSALGTLRGQPSLAGLPVVAYYSHVHDERAALARSAGASRVLPRGRFVQELPRLLRAAAGSGEEKNP